MAASISCDILLIDAQVRISLIRKLHIAGLSQGLHILPASTYTHA
jgi:hypothetical protein